MGAVMVLLLYRLNSMPTFMYRIKQLLRIFCILFFLLYSCPNARAQQGSDYAVQANIIYHFTKYIDWPGDKKSGDFVIGIIGDSPLSDALKAFIANKTAGNQKIVIKRFYASSASFNCHILFISDEESESLKKVSAKLTGLPVLLVTESEGLAQKGSCINFTIVDDHLKLEINKNNIVHRNLEIASELLQLGIPVK
jgi:hypothetical protein